MSRFLSKSVIIVFLFCFTSFFIFACSSLKMNSVIFSVMGDVPRSAEERITLKKQIELHNKLSPSEFMVHVGDIKSGSAPCEKKVFNDVAGFLKVLKIPTFMVPGDNEWNDCDNPEQAWEYWVKYFMKFENNWDSNFEVEHQPGQEENFVFIKKNILFIGINLVGGRVHDQEIWNEKMRLDVKWIRENLNRKNVLAAVLFAQANPNEKHDLFMKQFREEAKIFNKPILFIHGDGHRWLHDDPWLESNIVRIQVDQGGIADPLQITVIVGDKIKFEFERKPFQ